MLNAWLRRRARRRAFEMITVAHDFLLPYWFAGRLPDTMEVRAYMRDVLVEPEFDDDDRTVFLEACSQVGMTARDLREAMQGGKPPPPHDAPAHDTNRSPSNRNGVPSDQ